MAKTKISEFNANPALNTDIDSINIAEGCAPSGINDAIRELMAQLKDWQAGTSNDPMVIGSSGSLTLNQGTANGVAYLNGSKVVTSGSALTFDGTNLGIGTSSPVSKLHVRGATNGNLLVRGGASAASGLTGTALSSINDAASATVSLNFEGSDFNFVQSNAVKATLDSSGNLGLGVTPSAWGASKFAFQLGARASLYGASNLTVLGNNYYDNGTNNIYIATAAASDYYQSAGAHVWRNAASGTAGNAITFTQAATLGSDGNFLLGTTTTASFRLIASFLSSSGNGGIKLIDSQSNNTAAFINFSNGSGTLGSITNNGNGAVLYNLTSDQRLKQNIQDAESASTLIDSLQVRQYEWKSNGSHQRYGFIAQELYLVAPEAVYKPNDENEMMAVDYSKLVPMLIKEVQELRHRVATLEAQ